MLFFELFTNGIPKKLLSDSFPIRVYVDNFYWKSSGSNTPLGSGEALVSIACFAQTCCLKFWPFFRRVWNYQKVLILFCEYYFHVCSLRKDRLWKSFSEIFFTDLSFVLIGLFKILFEYVALFDYVCIVQCIELILQGFRLHRHNARYD